MSSVTLEDIRNLSAEVQALVAAGLPLETNLAKAGRGYGRRLEQLTETISTSLSEGQSLEDTIRDNKIGAPRMLAAAVAAGVQTGQLGGTIEMLGNLADDLVDLRQRVLQSMTYPLTIVAMAMLLFLISIRHFLNAVGRTLNDAAAQSTSTFQYIIALDAEYWWWPLVFPAVCLFLAMMWVFSGRADSMAFNGPEKVLLLLPGVGSMIRDLQFYSLTRMLSLMVERELPLSDSLLLAGACCGNAGLDTACQRTANELQKGNIPVPGSTENWRPGNLPPLLMACIRNCSQKEHLFNERLGSVVGYYDRRLSVSVSWLRNIIPIAMLLVVGGGTVALYGLTVFIPITELYRFLTPN
jgi:general secretion pathway protein F